MASPLILPPSIVRRQEAERDAREVQASKIFSRSLPRGEPELLMRNALLNIWLDSRHVPAEMLLWIGTDVASMAYGRYAIPPRRPVGPREAARLFRFGFAAMAGNIPELLTELGYNPVRAALGAFMMAKPWKCLRRQVGDAATRAGFARKLRQYDIASRYEDGVAYRDYEVWLEHNWPKDYLGRPDDLRAKIFHDLDPRFAAPRRAAPEVSRELLIKTARKKKYGYEWKRLDDADDILAGWVIRCMEQGHLTAGAYIGDDGLWYPDARGMVDAAVLRDGYSPARERPVTALKPESRVLDIAPAISPDPSDALEESAREHTLKRFFSLVASIEMEKLDRDNVVLMPEVKFRRARAERLGVDEKTLRNREDRLRARLRALADPAMLEMINEVGAA